MAIKTLILCDVHGEKCPKGATVETRKVFDRFTGRPYKKDLCIPEWDKEIGANDKFMQEAREVKVDTLPVPPTPNKKNKTKGGGGGSSAGGAAERWPGWEPLRDAYAKWYEKVNGKAPFGRWSPDGPATKKFLDHEDGAAWKEWRPGQITPS